MTTWNAPVHSNRASSRRARKSASVEARGETRATAFPPAPRSTVAAPRDVDHGLPRHVLHEADAPRAQDAAVRHVEDIGPEVLDWIEALGVLDVARAGAAFLKDEVLELALARLVADRTVEGVVDEQQLEHAHAALLRLLRLGAHHHPLGHRGRTGDLEFRRLLDLDQAHAAHARDRQPGVVAVVRDEDVRLLGGLDDERSLRDADRHVVDGEVDELVRHHPSPVPLPAQATMTGCLRPAM